MASQFKLLVRYARPALIALTLAGVHAGPPAVAGVRGQFDFPAKAIAVSDPATTGVPASSRTEIFEVTIPVSFRTLKGDPNDVLQIEVELTLGDEELQLLSYEPMTSLASSVVGEVEETVTKEESRKWGGAVGASVSIPGLDVAQIGPSVDVADSERTVRTETVRRRPKMAPVVIAGNTARNRGVFFQLRPGPNVTLEGAHHLTLRIAAPRQLHTSTLKIKCRGLAIEDWILFERKTTIAASKGQVELLFASPVAIGDASSDPPAVIVTDDPQRAAASPGKAVAPAGDLLHHTQRPCPWCDEAP